MTWCFTENKKFDSVKPYIKDLSERLGQSVRKSVTDNCCKDRTCLREAFERVFRQVGSPYAGPT